MAHLQGYLNTTKYEGYFDVQVAIYICIFALPKCNLCHSESLILFIVDFAGIWTK